MARTCSTVKQEIRRSAGVLHAFGPAVASVAITGPGTPLFGVAKWKGELWLAGGTFGLLRRKGTTAELEVVKPNLRANGFDARSSLVICCFDKVAGTSDGQKFKSFAAGGLLDARQGKDLLDFS